MKKHLLLITVFILLINGGLFAQKTKTAKADKTSSVSTVSSEELNKLPFSRNVWELSIAHPNLEYGNQNIKFNGVDQGSRSMLLLDASAHYYVADHFGVGLELNVNSSTFKNNGNKQTSNSWMSYADLTYGINVSSNVGFYARFGAGIGGAVTKFTPNMGPSSKNKSDLFGYKFSLGGPIRLEENGNAYLTPELGYWFNREKFNNETETDNRFGLGLKLETFLSCGKVSCASTKDYRQQHNMYNSGSSFLGATSNGGIFFGNTKTEYNFNIPANKQKYSLTNLSVNYNYYVVKNLAAGLNIDFSNSVYKNTTADYRQTNLSFAVAPMVELNLPVADHTLNNFFVRGGYSFGSQRSEYKSGNFTNTSKFSYSNICLGLGHNFFFTKKLAFTPVLEYDWTIYKDKDTDDKEKYNGLDFSVSIRKYFR